MINNVSDHIGTARTTWHPILLCGYAEHGRRGLCIYLSHRLGQSPVWVKLGDARGLVFTIGAGITTGVGFDDKWVAQGLLCSPPG